MPVTLYHKVINNVVVIHNKGKKNPPIKARIEQKTYGRRVTKDVRR